MTLMIGDRYRLDEPLATGGMGTVYRAFDQNLGRPVAVKVLRSSLVSDPTFIERFRREARAAGALTHAGVAKVFDYGERGGEPFIVMELVEGQNLAQRIAERGPLPWREACAIGAQVARALAAAHALGLVHRDVKPANILLDPSGFAKVTDFGIARADQATTLTRTGMVLGSANYVAPEQAQGITVGPAADQYSLGCVLFEAITGQPPYRGANAVAIATQHVDAPVPNPRERLPDLPGHVAALLARALAKNPGERFPSTAAIADALAAACSATPVARRPPVASGRPSGPSGSGRGADAPGAPVAPGVAGGAATYPLGAGSPLPPFPSDTAPLPWPLPPSGPAEGPAWRRGRAAGWRQAVRSRGAVAVAFVVLAAILLAWLALGLIGQHDHTGGVLGPLGPAPLPSARPVAVGGSASAVQVRVPDVRGERVAVATAELQTPGFSVRGQGEEQ
jgi:serine/threonine protein kinase